MTPSPDTPACDKSACGSCTACSDIPGVAAPPPPPPPTEAVTDDERLANRLSKIKRKILVMSGKGGVGKSTVATNLAVHLMLSGQRVGLLDVDIHGPSVPGMLHLNDARVQGDGESLLPLDYSTLKVMSIGFLLPASDDAVIWRGPMKMTLIRQFLQDVAWGELDCLVVDLPPGTGDEPLSICQLATPVDGAVIVTTPQQVSTADVRRSIRFCQKLKIPVLGVVENMSGFVCPGCGEVTHIFKTGGGERMATEMAVPFFGRIPLAPSIGAASDDGVPFICNQPPAESVQTFNNMAQAIQSLPPQKGDPS
ncbi:MAG: Mrp/NBP35 family ATP-binding protein [Kiritimatiellae bacterium]|nr:Mrp/NBP35 family ATP-binding protein [Kiritimatiellia bacterium]MDD4342466.1 Mrp/NBP35 family ATP-binding protein [Kiritimatiellia bacterium]MDY0149562.1 Mrp/NBP35 family ATP-binding protein [Kiritimatiellia bacterium]